MEDETLQGTPIRTSNVFAAQLEFLQAEENQAELPSPPPSPATVEVAVREHVPRDDVSTLSVSQDDIRIEKGATPAADTPSATTGLPAAAPAANAPSATTSVPAAAEVAVGVADVEEAMPSRLSEASETFKHHYTQLKHTKTFNDSKANTIVKNRSDPFKTILKRL